MMEGAFVLLLAGTFVYSLWSRAQNGDRRLQAWQDAARSCGLQVVEAVSSSMSPQLKARAGPFEVRIEIGAGKDRPIQILVVGPAPPDFYYVKVRTASLFQWAPEIEIGDAPFDSTFLIEGPPQLVLALLDAETRRLLSRLNAESQVDLSWGELRAGTTEEKIARVLPLLLDLRERFLPPIDVRQRLAENAAKDPEPGVRLQNLLRLIRELPADPGTIEVLRKACSDPSPEIRLRAAMKLGAEGRDVLLALAENPEDDDAVSAEAVSALEKELPFERATAILDRALSWHRLQTAYACLRVLGSRGAAAVDTLARILDHKRGELAPIAAWALGATGSPAAEPPLIEALQYEGTDLQVAAANALGRIGSAAAVEPLKELADRYLLGETRKAARQAIAEIQSRVQGASPGQLSLADAEAGQLSLADDPAGRLSLPPDSVSDHK